VSISRRAFLGATAALGPLGVKAFAAPGKLPTRTFGATGVQVPLLAFGCGSRFLAYKDDDEAVAVLSHAIDVGFTYVDTANNYGSGKSEERVGRLMTARRGEVFLQTKIAAREQGYVETVFKRRLYLPEINSRNSARRQYAERTAINAPMQGTAADIIKRAMIVIDRRITGSKHDIRLIMQVHDELVFEVADDILEQMRELIRLDMEQAAQLKVPLIVDVGVGANWDKAH